MSKKSTGRRQKDNEAMAYSKHIRISPQKLNLVRRAFAASPAATPLHP